jgi:hypothetical protein
MIVSDPLLDALIIGVLGNVLTDIVKMPHRIIKKHFTSNVQSIDFKNNQTSALISKGVEQSSYNAITDGLENFEEVTLFLQSEEVSSIIRKLFTYNFYEEIGESRPIEIPAIRDQFIKEYEKFFDKTCDDLEVEKLNRLFELLVEGAETILQSQLDNQFQAYDALQRFREISKTKALIEIQTGINDLRNKGKLNVKKILEFERELRFQMAEVHGKIIPPSFGDTKKLPIDDVYVTPNLYETDSDFLPVHNGNSILLNIDYFLREINKTLVVGNPGAGKTTLTDKLCYELATRYEERLIDNKWLSPIHIILRKYSEDKLKFNLSITDYIEKNINSRYQLRPPEGAIEYLLINGRAVVFFDGLDELLDVGNRKDIVSDIEAFQHRYPFIKILVTSREIGYGRAPLSENKFTIYKIAPFNEKQTEEYIRKWFSTDKTLTLEEQGNKANSFLLESKKVPDLTSNPLMLSLMCLLYKGEGYIPSNRPDLYEKCSKMLFEMWDRGRNIGSYTPFEDYFKSTLMFIAYWIYSEESKSKLDLEEFQADESLFKDDFDSYFDENLDVQTEINTGFNEKLIIRIASEYLTDYFDTYEQAENYAQKLIDFCKNRAWVFTDVGEDSYNFTHRTFLEYFTANYLVKNYKSIDEFVKFLLPKIKKNEWFLVNQLAIQIKNQSYDKAADDIIDILIQKSDEMDLEEKEVTQVFICNSLQFINFSTKTRNLIFKLVKDLMDQEITTLEMGNFSKSNDHLRTLLIELSKSNTANIGTINNSIENYVTSLIHSGNLKDIKYAILLLIDLPYLYQSDKNRNDEVSGWSTLSRICLGKIATQKLVEISLLDRETALIISSVVGIIDDCIQKYGASYLLPAAATIYSRKVVLPLYFRFIDEFNNSNFLSDHKTVLKKIGADVSRNTLHYVLDDFSIQIPPSSSKPPIMNTNLLSFMSENKDKDILIGLFWLFSMLFEKGREAFVLGAIKSSDLINIFQARLYLRSELIDFKKLEEYQLDEIQTQLLKEWVSKKIRFVLK